MGVDRREERGDGGSEVEGGGVALSAWVLYPIVPGA